MPDRNEAGPESRWRIALRLPTVVTHRLVEARGWDLSKDIHVLALVKGEERYLFLYNDATKAEVLRTLGRFASNVELSFNWYDAAVLGQKVRANKQAAAPIPPIAVGRFELPPVSDLFPAE